MPIGIICSGITPARGNHEHRPLSGAVFYNCFHLLLSWYKLNKTVIFYVMLGAALECENLAANS